MNLDDSPARLDTGRVDVVRLSSLEQIREATGTWERLLELDSEASLYQSPRLFFAWQQAGDMKDRPWFLLARINGEPVGCAALTLVPAVVRGFRLRALTFGNPRGDFVASHNRAQVIAGFVNYL